MYGIYILYIYYCNWKGMFCGIVAAIISTCIMKSRKRTGKKKNTAMLIYWTPHWLRPTLGTAATKKQQQKGSCLFGFCSSLFFFFSWCHLALLICALTFDWDYDTVLGSLNSQIHSIVATPGFVFVSDWRRIKWCWAKWILIASNGMWGDLRHLE